MPSLKVKQKELLDAKVIKSLDDVVWGVVGENYKERKPVLKDGKPVVIGDAELMYK